MPSADRMLTYLRQAAMLTRATPGRWGHSLELKNCTEVVVAGDLHGHIPHFQAVFQAADLAENPTRHLILQELIHSKFRYSKGGDKSHQLVDLFAALKGQFPKQVHYLLGNHELAQWTKRPVIKSNENLNALFEEGVIEAYGTEIGPQIYVAYLELFQSLPVAITTPNKVLICHSAPNARVLPYFNPARLRATEYEPADLQPGGAVHSVLWGRDTSQEVIAGFLERMEANLLVSGHIACEDGYSIPNDRQLILDCAENPACYVTFPTDRPISLHELIEGVRSI